MSRILLLAGWIVIGCTNAAQEPDLKILTGADQTNAYMGSLTGKQVGLTVNQTSTIGATHLVDSLLQRNLSVAKVFTPEHGFKGTVSDGAEIEYKEKREAFELVSLYGKNKKPTSEQLQGLDVMIFDIQDVGTRFYTYISTMHYVMEACAENDLPLLILDRPNPHGSYVDGPVLDTALRSFVGMHPIPIVHGMTVGELAQMINGEGWLANGLKCELTVIPVRNWDHSTPYSLPVRPSPNLPDDLSISLYPSLCLFEGTIMSVGRGTQLAFQQIGHPDYPDTTHSFVPKSWEGSKWPPYEGETCFGVSWTGQSADYTFSLSPLIETFNKMKQTDFFNDYFKRLAGTEELQEQIEAGMREEEIRKSWEADLQQFKEMRNKYLIYK